MDSFTILTFNAGLLRVSALGKVLAEPTPFLEERFAHMAPAIARVNADIVAMQEIFFDAFRNGLVTSLRPHYAHVAQFEQGRWPNLGNGMLLFAKFPIVHAEYVRFRDVGILDRILVNKGALLATLEVAEFGRLCVACTHARAGGHSYNESQPVVSGRSRNLMAAVRHIRAQEAGARVIAGDLNCGPESSRVTYEEVLAQGFQDAVTGTQVEREHTWDPNTLLNKLGTHNGGPARRIDHVLIDQSAELPLRTVTAQVVFTEPLVPTSDGLMTLSDHYGLVVRLAKVG